MATTERDIVGERRRGSAPGAGRPADGWQPWFEPAAAWRPRGQDVFIAAVAAFVQVAGTILYSRHELPSPWELDWFGIFVLLVGPVALLFRRRWPESMLVVTFVAAAGYAASGYPRGPAGLPAFAFALVTVIMMGDRRVAWGVLGVSFPALTGLAHVNPDALEETQSIAVAATNLLWLPLVVAVAEILRVRLERRGEQEAAAQEDHRRRADEERLQIARELHDVLAHTISLINVQSGIALHLLDEHPEHARPALDAINTASDEALGELQWVLDVLHRGVGRDAATDEPWSEAPRSPTPGLRDVDRLVQRTRAAGLDVEVTVEGKALQVPARVDLAAYRILQEALTNVVRHAGGDARATIELRYEPTEILVQVTDDGHGVDAHRAGGEGRGLAGMRQRVDAVGGSFMAGPRPGHGFCVRARLPLGDVRQ